VRAKGHGRLNCVSGRPGCSAAWQRASFGTKRPPVQIRPPRPSSQATCDHRRWPPRMPYSSEVQQWLLESATRAAASELDQAEARDLLGDVYQATAATMAKIGETRCGMDRGPGRILRRAGGEPLAVAASMFRMAHVFLVLGQIDQAHHVATNMAHALEPKITPGAGPEVLSLCGAAHLVLAVCRSPQQRTRAGSRASRHCPEDRRAARRRPRRLRDRVRPYQRRHPRSQRRCLAWRRRARHRPGPAGQPGQPLT
jgi:hypothetical protein